MAGLAVQLAAGKALGSALAAAATDAAATWLDAIFPPRCAGCDQPGAHFCPACIARLRPVPPPWCPSCGRPRLRAGLCGVCRVEPLPLEGVRSLALFEDPLRRAVHRLKYRGRRAAGRTLGELLAIPAAALPLTPDALGQLLIAPVPLHPERERARGYNQAALLARPLARRLRATHAPQLLRRIRSTASQVGLTAAQRRENVRDAFEAGAACAGRRVLLVDDVTTTGSTLGSAAAASRRAGATAVYAVTLGREA